MLRATITAMESFSPSELLSVSFGSCILSIMGMTARSIGVDISGVTTKVQKEMTNTPRRISKIAVNVRVPGSFDEKQRRTLEEAAHSCPVHDALNVEVPITFDWDSEK